MDDLDLAFTQYHTSFDENNVILCENELTAFKFEMFVNLNIDPFHRSNGFARFSLLFFCSKNIVHEHSSFISNEFFSP